MEEKNTNTHYRKLKPVITGILLLVSFLPMIFISGILYYRSKDLLKARTLEHLKSITESHRDAVDLFLKEKLNDLKVLSLIHSFDYLKNRSNLKKVFAICQEQHGTFIDLGVIDDSGRHIAYQGPFRLDDKNYKKTPWFAEVMKKGEYISDVFLGFRKVPHFIIAVKQKEKDRIWILRATIDSEKFNFLVENVKIGKTGEAYIINSQGYYQTQPRSGNEILELSAHKDLKYFNGINLAENRFNNEKFLQASTWLKNGDWLLIVRQNLAEAYASLHKIKYFVVTIFYFSAICIILVIILCTWFLVNTIQQLDKEKNELREEQLICMSKLADTGKLGAVVAEEINYPLSSSENNQGNL